MPCQGSQEWYVHEGRFICETGKDNNVAEVFADGHRRADNAHLIAAAPLLLQACQAALQALGDHLDDCPCREPEPQACDCGYGKIEAALTAAQGKE